ncbi:MAG: hypothetical protein Q8K67_12415 [Geothrix sp.]|nr:hypothetical protein [Geothrix sp.]
MAAVDRKPVLDRLAALVAGPFLLGRRALNLDWAQAEGGPPKPPPAAPAPIAITPPPHAIKRRG